MLDKETLILKLNKIIYVAKIHLDRMNTAFNFIKPSLPVTESNYIMMSNEQVAYIDQFIFRFAKLQDLIGQNLFKIILLLEEEDIRNYSFRDLINKIEQFGIIESDEKWFKLREIRNDVSHEYPVADEEAIIALNQLFNNKNQLEIVLGSCISFLKSKNHLK